ALCGSMGLTQPDDEEEPRAGGFTALRPIAGSSVPLRTSAAVSAGASAAVAAAPEILLLTDEESAPLRTFYATEMRPFLENPRQNSRRLADHAKSNSSFAGLKTLFPAAAQSTISDLQNICDKTRQLIR